jgi:hypothetical protein
MRLHLIISRDASGNVRSEYLGPDKAEASAIYEMAGAAGETVEMYSFLQITRRRKLEPAPVKKSK